MRRKPTANRRLAKKRFAFLNNAFRFLFSLSAVDNFIVLNPLLRQAPKRCVQP